MKHKATQEKQFQPITLTLTFETNNEAEIFASLVNMAPINDALEEKGLKMSCEILNEVGIFT
jgi:hypothetical protein